MGTLERRLLDYVSPHYTGIKNADDFWNRSKKYMVNNNPAIEDILKEAERTGTRGQIEKRIEQLTKENFDKHGAEYFKPSKVATASRYVAAGLGAYGGLSAIGAIVGTVLGGPVLPLLAGAGAAMTAVMAGAGINVATDLYESMRMHKSLNKDESTGTLNYIKKSAKGAWYTITGPFRKRSYSPLAEGAINNLIAAKGAGFISEYLSPLLGGATPYAQAAALATSGIAFDRGTKKFQDQVANYIRDKTSEQLRKELNVASQLDVKSLDQRMKEYVRPFDGYTPVRGSIWPMPPGVDPKQPHIMAQPMKQLNYVAPRGG
ncbi:hypothetical protein ACFLZX_00910 [Nanoarchaeota archaeon]